MSDAQTKLGLSCPKEGKFYICNNADIRFVGCCTVDPCTKERGGVCPTDDVRPASFSSDAYNQIGQQSCFSPESDDIWYTCKAMADNPTPFMGCCKSNPCSADGCATEDLFPARLSDNPDKAQIFLASGSTSTPAPEASESSFPKGAVIGIAIGAASLVCILIAILMYRRRHVARKRKSEKEAEEAAKLYNPGYQGPYTPGHSPGFSPGLVSNWPGSQPGSPGMGYGPYNSQTYNDHHLSSTAASDWNPSSRHVSELSGMSWDAVAANMNHHKRYSQLPQESYVTELDGVMTAPTSSQLHHTPEGSQYRTELDATTSETRPPASPRTVAELPGADRR